MPETAVVSSISETCNVCGQSDEVRFCRACKMSGCTVSVDSQMKFGFCRACKMSGCTAGMQKGLAAACCPCASGFNCQHSRYRRRTLHFAACNNGGGYSDHLTVVAEDGLEGSDHRVLSSTWLLRTPRLSPSLRRSFHTSAFHQRLLDWSRLSFPCGVAAI